MQLCLQTKDLDGFKALLPYCPILYCPFQAGIPSERLLICLEPEAAAIFCKAVSGLSVNSKFELQKYLSNFQDGCRYIIIDAGGM